MCPGVIGEPISGKAVMHWVCPRGSNGNSSGGAITFEEKVLKLGHALYPWEG